MQLDKLDGDTPLVERRTAELEPKKELGREFLRQLQSAVSTRSATRVGEYSLGELLRECKKARDDAPSQAELDFRDKYPAWTMMPISIVGFKVTLLVSMLRENLVEVAHAPFIIDPTPNPEIPQSERDRIVREVYADLLQQAELVVAQQKGFADSALAQGADIGTVISSGLMPTLSGDDLVEMMRQRKAELVEEIRRHAEDEAAMLQRDLHDKVVEGGWRDAIVPFIDDFATYPFACIHGPTPVVRSEARWKKDKFVDEKSIVWTYERVSPFDFYWTADCTSPQDGTAVFIRKRVGYDYLFDALEIARSDENSGYIKEAIEDLVEMLQDGSIPRYWCALLLNPEKNDGGLPWHRGETAELIIRYGRHTGYELHEYGFSGVEKTKIYETKSIMCGGQIIYLTINKNPSQYKRPVFCTSFETRNGSIAGVGLAQRLLSLHKAYRNVMQLCMYHLGYLSEPITVLDYNRIMQYMPQEWIENPVVSPGLVIPTEPDRTMRGDAPVRFLEIPNSVDSLLRMANHIFELSHVVSNIPAALHGQPVGSGANRTVRGLLTLQGNTLKPIQSAMINLDRHVIEPMVTLLYMLLVMHDDDFEYSGDCKIVAKGAASMIERELKAQQAMENLQIVGQVAAYIPPDILHSSVEELLRLTGILTDGKRLPMMPPGGIAGQAPTDTAAMGNEPSQEPVPPIQ